MLGLAVTTHLYPRLPADAFGAGRLTQIRAQIVSGRACRGVAERLGVPQRMRTVAPGAFGRGVEALVGTERVLASVMEAIIGACYLNAGYEPSAEAIVEAFAPEIDAALHGSLDFKSALQERLARGGAVVAYRVEEEVGPPHDRTFAVSARVDEEELGRGRGRSKKDAEQEAARAALARLEGQRA